MVGRADEHLPASEITALPVEWEGTVRTAAVEMVEPVGQHCN